MSKRGGHSLWYLLPVGLLAVGLASLLVFSVPTGGPVDMAIRLAASLGYIGVFLAIVSSRFLRELVRFFGRPFIRVHHIVSLTGLVLITLHPIGAAVNAGSADVFLPRFDSFYTFFALGGRPAWYLIGLAALVAWQRRAMGECWRVLHTLNYLAFLLATAHANLIGTNFHACVLARIVSILMALAVIAIFVEKRVRARGKSKSQARSAA